MQDQGEHGAYSRKSGEERHPGPIMGLGQQRCRRGTTQAQREHTHTETNRTALAYNSVSHTLTSTGFTCHPLRFIEIYKTAKDILALRSWNALFQMMVAAIYSEALNLCRFVTVRLVIIEENVVPGGGWALDSMSLLALIIDCSNPLPEYVFKEQEQIKTYLDASGCLSFRTSPPVTGCRSWIGAKHPQCCLTYRLGGKILSLLSVGEVLMRRA